MLDDILCNVKRKRLSLQIRDPEGSKEFKVYLLTYSNFVIICKRLDRPSEQSGIGHTVI